MQNIDKSHINKLYFGQNKLLLESIQSIIAPKSQEIADSFFLKLSSFPKVDEFLGHKDVKERFSRIVAEWLVALFRPSTDREIDDFIDYQKKIGTIHARINVSMNLVNLASGILKKECYRRIMESPSIVINQQVDAVVLMGDLLDISASLINGSFVENSILHERNIQSLRMHYAGQNLVIECERVRSSLFDWMRKALTFIYEEGGNGMPESLQVESSDFGQWVRYKLELYFAGVEEADRLYKQMEKISEVFKKSMATRKGDVGDFKASINDLNDSVTQASILISSLSEQTQEADHSRDPLTRVFNRRYLPAIMQQTIRISSSINSSFAIILLDVDHFKMINDRNGHNAGDDILVELAEIFLASVRVSDYIFRYGGEEFLVLLTDVNREAAIKVSENIRKAVAEHPFMINEGKIPVTVSGGVAISDGHPDYSKVISRADAALYRAKDIGRNCCVCS